MRKAIWMIPVMALIILVPAMVNGYPLVYSDTGTYLRSGFEMFLPVDRPIGYGIFLRATSLNGTTIWLSMLAQALLCAVLIWRTWLFLAPHVRPSIVVLISLLLSLGSALGWYGGRIMPDIFTSLAVLAVLLHYFDGRSFKWMLFDVGIIILACITHLSNLPVIGGLLLFLLLLSLIERRSLRPILWRIGIPFIALAASVLIVKTLNRITTGDARYSTGGHVFIIGRLMDAKLLDPFLDQDCMTNQHFLCDHGPLPVNSQKLLWDPDSPMNGPGGWAARKDESDALLGRFFSDPGNLLSFIYAGIRDTGRQLGMWGLENEMISSWYRADDSAPTNMVRAHLPHELDAYRSSLQNGGRGELRMIEVNILHHFILGFSLLAIPILFIRDPRSDRPRSHVLFLASIIVGILLGAASGAALSTPHQRFLAKVSWTLPLTVMLIAAGSTRSKFFVGPHR